MTPKEQAISFLTLASSNRVNEAFEQFIHPDFKHHSPYFKGDRESFRVAMEENCKVFPDKTYKVIHALEDGDLVTLHGRVELGAATYGVIHIFRRADGLIIESWEASQEELKNSVNENGLF